MTSNQATAPVKARHDIPVINLRSVFTIEQARTTLQLAKNCLPREIRLGRLRVAKRAGKYLILGRWLLQWIAGGEVNRPAKAGGAARDGACLKDRGNGRAAE